MEKREGDGDFEHFSYFSSPVFDHRAKPPRDLYISAERTNSVYEFLYNQRCDFTTDTGGAGKLEREREDRLSGLRSKDLRI